MCKNMLIRVQKVIQISQDFAFGDITFVRLDDDFLNSASKIIWSFDLFAFDGPQEVYKKTQKNQRPNFID